MDIQTTIKQELQIWLTPADPDEPLEEAVERAKALGNTIIKVDYKNRQILVLKENING